MTDMKVVSDGKVGYDFIILSMVKVNSACQRRPLGFNTDTVCQQMPSRV